MLTPKKKIVIAVHGIETHGIWEMELAPLISEQGWIIYPLHYGRFPFYKLPIPYSQNKMIDWFRDQYNRIRARHKEVIPSVIAHSFGTRIVTGAIMKYNHIQLDKIVLCGSIVKQDYDWHKIFKRKQATAVKNDYGGRDFWTGMPLIFVPNTGKSGRSGFITKSPKLIQCEYEEYGHGSAFGIDHYERSWIPFLKEIHLFDGETTPPYDFEEPVSPNDAAKWSAITYFHQFITPVVNSLNSRGRIKTSNNEDANVKKLIVITPATPGKAQRSAISAMYRDLKAEEISIVLDDRQLRGQLFQSEFIIDIPTIINSLIFLDHRSDNELVESIDEFSNMLQELINSSKYDFAERVVVKSYPRFVSEYLN